MIAALPAKAVDRPDPVAYGRSLRHGIGINLLVTDIAAMIRFLHDVLAIETRYWDDDFAICTGHGGSFMLHHDRTYRHHPMRASLPDTDGPRGGGIELRLYGCDPDRACAAAQEHDAIVLEPAVDKPHGTREAFIVGPDGYVWVPSLPDDAHG